MSENHQQKCPWQHTEKWYTVKDNPVGDIKKIEYGLGKIYFSGKYPNIEVCRWTHEAGNIRKH